jgi:small subunit ribosomal protein S17
MADEQSKTSRLQERIGVVASISGRSTIRVVIQHLVKNARYGKFLRRRTTLAVHDADSQAAVGDKVAIVPCRRMSKTKSWRLIRVIGHADLVAASPVEEGLSK